MLGLRVRNTTQNAAQLGFVANAALLATLVAESASAMCTDGLLCCQPGCCSPFSHPPQGMVAAWEASCGPLDQYGMRHTRAFANLCNLGLAPAALAANSCGGPAAGAGSKLVGPDAHIAAA